MFPDGRGKDSVGFFLGLRDSLLRKNILIINPTMIDHVLCLLEERLVLRLEHFQLLQRLIADLFDFMLILFVNSPLNVPPVAVGELLFIAVWIYLG